MSTKKRNQTAPTQAQLNARDRFRQAARYAKELLLDPERKQHYTEKARTEGLPNAYVAAVTEYLRTTPLMKIMGSVKRAIHRPQTQTKAIKPINPVADRAPTIRPLRMKKTGEIKGVVMHMRGFTVEIICSADVRFSALYSK